MEFAPTPEIKLKKYTYTDNNSPDKDVIFECEANDILEADKKYLETTGNDIKKQAHIGCSFEEITQND